MNINPDYQENEPNAEQIMDLAMSYLWDNFIEPKQNELTETDAELLAVIGSSLKHIAKQAKEMEKLKDSLPFNEEDISLN